ncbi:MAG: SEC-C domain-containing protein [Alphaproteobacteria bacterium]|nr:hypothetical protein [Rhizobiaceae bacterium]MBU4135583.1 SEC-C domain-containing protein [Alphaproteobacteria bacterium]
MNDARLEADIFEDLRHLCQSPGYVHAIGFFCFRDNLIRFGDQLNSEAMESQHAPDRLLRTEIATLIGLMVQVPFDAAVPAPAQFQAYIDQTQALLKELHDSLSAGWLVGFRPSDGLMSISDPFSSGENLREPMFYAGESAYGFQYSAFAELKHAVDDGWLLEKKGFEIADAVRLAQALENILTERQMAQSKALRGLPPENWTMLPGFTFTLEEVLAVSDLDAKRAVAVLSAFTLPAEDRNSRFTGLNAFNATNAMPILHHGAGDYLLLQQYSLLESIYESPFFWMMGDPDYKAKALTHRGEFTETFAMQTLREVFGAGRVHQNVDIYHPNGQRLGEIDVLVVYGSRAIVVQAKSKRLTIEARSGNDRQLKRDFKLAVQSAADQAAMCAEAICNPANRLTHADGRPITINRGFRTVLPVCLVSDHYPALSFQVRQFLKSRTTDVIAEPLVTDIFALDVMGELLATPLHFLNYLTLRALFAEKFMASNELAMLGYHLGHNLWGDDEYTMMTLADDFSVGVDIAMLARRTGVPGEPTPKGILTRLRNKPLGRLVEQIEASEDPQMADLGLTFLQLGSETVAALNEGLEVIALRAKQTRRTHDMSLHFDGPSGGITIHCGHDLSRGAAERLMAHCELKKYSLKADRWHGLLVDPVTGTIHVGVGSTAPWSHNPALDELAGQLPQTAPVPWREAFKTPPKVGRNDPCPCGSGRKFKACCRS